MRKFNVAIMVDSTTYKPFPAVMVIEDNQSTRLNISDKLKNTLGPGFDKFEFLNEVLIENSLPLATEEEIQFIKQRDNHFGLK